MTMTDRIRILYVVDRLDDPGCGTTAHLTRLVASLDRQHFSPMIMAIRPIRPGFDTAVYSCPVGSVGMRGQGMLSVWRARWKLNRLLRPGQFDLVCAYDYWGRVIGLPEAQAAGVPVCVAAVQDMGQNLMPDTLVELQEANRAASRFVTNAGASAARLVRQERINRDRIDIIPGGINWREIAERTPQGAADAKHSFGFSLQQPVVVLNAPPDGTQNLVAFLRAAAHLLPHHPMAQFVILGTDFDPDIEDAQAAAGRLGVENHLTIESDPEIQKRWLLAADVAVSTSLFESCSDTLLLYMALGLPIVAVDAGGNAELIVHGQTGYLVPPVEADALAMRIHLLLTAEDLATEFGAAARERVSTEFDLSREVRRFSDYYRTLTYSSGCSLGG